MEPNLRVANYVFRRLKKVDKVGVNINMTVLVYEFRFRSLSVYRIGIHKENFKVKALSLLILTGV